MQGARGDTVDFLSLPLDAYIYVAGFLPVKALVSLSQCCHFLQRIANHNRIWSRFTRRHFNVVTWTKALETEGEAKRLYVNRQRFFKGLRESSPGVEFVKSCNGRCTFCVTGRYHKMQPYFQCQTCTDTVQHPYVGVCINCAKVCHAGHILKPEKCSFVYCYCGAGDEKLATKPTNYTACKIKLSQ